MKSNEQKEHKQKEPRALFILKRREDYSTDLENFTNFTVSTGMYNSARFVSDMIEKSGIESKVVVVLDNNCIDREVNEFKPTHVFIEGYWVVPDKFDVLTKLHPEVTWVVRCHSEMPFLSQEGVAIDWTFEYLRRGITVSGNSPRINRELRVIASSSLGLDIKQLEDKIPLLSNYYPVDKFTFGLKPMNGVVNVGCFGACRPLKNHLIQAIAAIEYAEYHKLKLKFHINSGRIEMNGANQLKNIKSLFEAHKEHELVEHPWASHEDFLSVIKSMDICLQVSFTETFNIVTADAVNLGIPVLTSAEIDWVEVPHANPTSSVDIFEKMNQVMSGRNHLVEKNRDKLKRYSRQSSVRWVDYLKGKRGLFGLNLDTFNKTDDFYYND